MEINVTSIVTAHLDGNPPAHLCSGSRAELGENAGQITWGNSRQLAGNLPGFLETPDELEAVRDHIRTLGAWDDEEIAAFSDSDLRAFIVQEVMADIRHLEDYGQIDLNDFTEEEFRAATENEGGTLYKGDVPGHPGFGQWFFYLGY